MSNVEAPGETAAIQDEKVSTQAGRITEIQTSSDLGTHNLKSGENISTNSVAYPTSLPLALLITGISLSCFLVAVDRTIVATAIPHITDDFQVRCFTINIATSLCGTILFSFSVKVHVSSASLEQPLIKRSVSGRRWVVWIGVPSHLLCISAYLRLHLCSL